MRQNLLRSAKPTAGRLLTNCPARRSFAATARASAEVEVTIDGKKVMIEQGSALIQACEKAGVTIPRYCYHVCSTHASFTFPHSPNCIPDARTPGSYGGWCIQITDDATNTYRKNS